MKEYIEVTGLDGIIKTFNGDMEKSAKSYAERLIKKYLRQEGILSHNIAWVGDSECFAVDSQCTKVLTSTVMVDFIMR